MASRTWKEYLHGKANWVRATAPDKYGKWSLQFYPNAEGLEKIREMKAKGLKNVLGKDDDGYYMRFNRPTSREIRGKVVGMEPPLILEADGKTPLQNTLVGNGSDVMLKLECYTFNVSGVAGMAARWEGLRVDTLIPYDGKRDFDDADKTKAKFMDTIPKQTEDAW